MSGHIAERASAEQMADAATSGYAGSYLEAQGPGLRVGMERYGLRAGRDAETVAIRFDNDRGAAKVRKRADLDCLTDAVYYEARGESARGQAAVAQVVMNRVKHPAFPKTVCGVVFQGATRAQCQFSFACDGSMRRNRESAAWDRARAVAKRALAGAAGAEIGRATHFHTTAVSPFWAPRMSRVAQVGTHVFYKFAPRGTRPAQTIQASVQTAMLTSGAAGPVADLRILPSMSEVAIEASLQPVSDVKATPGQPAAAAAPAKLGDGASKPAPEGKAKVAGTTQKVAAEAKPKPKAAQPGLGSPKSSEAAALTSPQAASAAAS